MNTLKLLLLQLPFELVDSLGEGGADDDDDAEVLTLILGELLRLREGEEGCGGVTLAAGLIWTVLLATTISWLDVSKSNRSKHRSFPYTSTVATPLKVLIQVMVDTGQSSSCCKSFKQVPCKTSQSRTELPDELRANGSDS